MPPSPRRLDLDVSWMSRAACRGRYPNGPAEQPGDVDRNGDPMHIFYPGGRGDSTAKGRAVCARCPVKQECEDYAIRADERWGVWGGNASRDMKAKRRQYKKAG